MRKLNTITGADGRILSVAFEGYHCGKNEALYSYQDDFDFDHVHDYRIVDGQLLHDPVQVEDPIDPLQQRLDEIEAAMLELAEMLGGE